MLTDCLSMGIGHKNGRMVRHVGAGAFRPKVATRRTFGIHYQTGNMDFFGG